MIIRALVLINFIVFLAWSFSPQLEFFPFMMENFTVSWVGLRNGQYWTLVTSVFSHSAFLHLFINMYVLYGFGMALKKLLGRSQFFFFYLLAGVTGSFMHAVLSLLYTNSPMQPALGASGAIAGIILFFSLSFPKVKLLLLGFIPISARWAAVLLVFLDLWGLSAQSQGGGLPIGHGAHLGGALIGVVYYFFIRPPRNLTKDGP
jgi:membrane associated rhomboid family serine protease